MECPLDRGSDPDPQATEKDTMDIETDENEIVLEAAGELGVDAATLDPLDALEALEG